MPRLAFFKPHASDVNTLRKVHANPDFRCLSTISKHNALVMRSHANNKAMKVLKELSHDYMLVEFVKPAPG